VQPNVSRHSQLPVPAALAGRLQQCMRWRRCCVQLLLHWLLLLRLTCLLLGLQMTFR
jgi:hypothetical protein